MTPGTAASLWKPMSGCWPTRRVRNKHSMAGTGTAEQEGEKLLLVPWVIPRATSQNFFSALHTTFLRQGCSDPQPSWGWQNSAGKKLFQEERHGKPLAKNDKRIIAIFTVNSKTLFFFLLRRLTSRKEKTSHGLVKGSMLLYKMQVLAWGYSGPWASQLNCRECHAEDDSSSSLEKPKQKIPLFSHALSYIWHTCFLLWLIPFSVVEISGYEDSVGTERQLTAYGTCWQPINMGNGKTGKNK